MASNQSENEATASAQERIEEMARQVGTLADKLDALYASVQSISEQVNTPSAGGAEPADASSQADGGDTELALPPPCASSSSRSTNRSGALWPSM